MEVQSSCDLYSSVETSEVIDNRVASTPGSYLSGEGMLLIRLKRPSQPVVVFRHLMPGDHGFRFQGLKLVERGDPLKPAPCVGLAELGMNSVVDGVPANDQSDRRDVQAGGVSRIGPPRVHRDKLVPLQLTRRISCPPSVTSNGGEKSRRPSKIMSA